MTLLTNYYRANKLKINEQKTTFMVISHDEEPGRRFEIKVNEKDKIKDDLAVKVLGWWVSPNGHLTHHFNKIRGQDMSCTLYLTVVTCVPVSSVTTIM